MPTAAERGGDFSADVTTALASLNSGGSATATTTCNAPAPATFTQGAGGVWTATSNIPVGFQAAGNPYAIANPMRPASCWRLTIRFRTSRATFPEPTSTSLQNQSGRVPWREENVRIDLRPDQEEPHQLPLHAGCLEFPRTEQRFRLGRHQLRNLSGQLGSTLQEHHGQRSPPRSAAALINDFEFGYSHNAIIVTPGGTNPTLGRSV